MLGLSGADPEYIPVESIDVIISAIKIKRNLLGNEIIIPFHADTDIVFHRNFYLFMQMVYALQLQQMQMCLQKPIIQ